VEAQSSGGTPALNHLFLQYFYLQGLDFLTTIAFLLNGVQEGNPLVRFAIEASPSPWSGLLAVKLLAVFLGIYCWRFGKGRVLARANLLFALIVVWNLVALIVGSAAV
jgi:hypothetical protein